jgi:hypothetical protein
MQMPEARMLQPGQLVVHPNKSAWGPGKVVHVDRRNVHVVWRDHVGRSPNQAMPIARGPITLTLADCQTDPQLDHLPPVVERDGAFVLEKPRITFDEALGRFLARYPGGFSNTAYIGKAGPNPDGERAYKVAAHEKAASALDVDADHGGRSRLTLMIEDGCINEAAKSVRRAIAGINLLSTFEHAAIGDALADPEASKPFIVALGQLLDDAEDDSRVPRYLDAVCGLPQSRGRVATWPVATILPFLVRPKRFMFLKPKVTEAAAALLGFDLMYDTEPNPTTWRQLHRLAGAYAGRLTAAGHEPADLMDVQSFLWIAAGG